MKGIDSSVNRPVSLGTRHQELFDMAPDYKKNSKRLKQVPGPETIAGVNPGVGHSMIGIFGRSHRYQGKKDQRTANVRKKYGFGRR